MNVNTRTHAQKHARTRAHRATHKHTHFKRYIHTHVHTHTHREREREKERRTKEKMNEKREKARKSTHTSEDTHDSSTFRTWSRMVGACSLTTEVGEEERGCFVKGCLWGLRCEPHEEHRRGTGTKKPRHQGETQQNKKKKRRKKPRGNLGPPGSLAELGRHGHLLLQFTHNPQQVLDIQPPNQAAQRTGRGTKK